MAHRTGKLFVAFVLLVLVLPAEAQRRGDAITITIPAAAIQGATTGHAYWINVDDAGVGSLTDAGTSIAAANPTNQPPEYWDVGRVDELSWSVFYGAQTGNVGGKIGMAELWPSQPVEVSGTIPPYVRDVASHWIVTAGLGFVLQGSIPEPVSVLYDVSSAVNTPLDTRPLLVDDMAAVVGMLTSSSGNTAGAVNRVADDSSIVLMGNTASAALVGIAWNPGAAAIVASSAPLATVTVPFQVPRRISQTSTAIVGQTTRIQMLGERKRPLRRPSRIAPYVQWVNPGTGGATPVVPTAASPIYLVLRGR